VKYPNTKSEAIVLLQQVRNGFGGSISEHLIRYCLLMTGDLA
jgi:hypothetical protein